MILGPFELAPWCKLRDKEDPAFYLVPRDNILQDIPSIALPPEPIPPPPKSTPELVQEPYNSSGQSNPHRNMTSEQLKREFYRKKIKLVDQEASQSKTLFEIQLKKLELEVDVLQKQVQI
ncbi:hypothetical protein HHI36_018626 [Cryptolaemus montrouzieri]|uniref:Uncharacterized protein n=1 Tax=Cryptolaemus montrouzieri TaxID=559131 RepID=A0ABD2P1P2_9CUCU